MVYIDPDDLKWLPFVRSWIQNSDETILIPEMKEFMETLFENYVENGFLFIKKSCTFFINQVCCLILNRT